MFCIFIKYKDPETKNSICHLPFDGLLYINSGLNKFFNYMPMPEDMPEKTKQFFDAFVSIVWLMPLVAIAEIGGGILFILKKYRALGAIILLPITIGILLTHIVQAPDGLIMGIILMAINLWVIYENREKYMPMIN